jgi:hypothetical protein
MCSGQFGTLSCRFGMLSHHHFFQFHEMKKVPAFFLVDVGMVATGIE